MEKEIKITPPEGYEIDKENSTFECIKFKPIKPKRFIDDKNHKIAGYYIDDCSCISLYSGYNVGSNYNVFATRKLAKAALAIARLSQIRIYDERFTEVNPTSKICCYYTIYKQQLNNNKINLYIGEVAKTYMTNIEKLIYFNTEEEANLFLEENKELLLDYFTIND